MRVGYNWLKSYIDFPYSPQELAERMTMAGMEVEDIEYMGKGLEDIIIGEIVKIKDHPNADKLVICEINTGEDLLKIVTGASNVFEGAKIPVATIGVTLPNGMKIKKAKLRGESSFGMLCSTDELGLSTKRAQGIMILKEDAEIGMKLIDYLDLNEYILKLDLTPNYGRCLGMLGLARELKAMLDTGKIKYPEIKLKEIKERNINDFIQVEIKDEKLCPRYTGRLIKNVKIASSPEWLQQRLSVAGIRSINNVVDITNYVLMEYNQPLHVFDYDKIEGKKIVIRSAVKDEILTTLDGKKRQLNNEHLVIADQNKPIALAGVMGGVNSEVTLETSNIFLESAYFNPVSIRKTARKFGLPTEASHRFERGIDIEKIVEANNRAAYLFQKYAGGEVVEGMIDLYPKPFENLVINLKVDLVNKILGLSLSEKEIKEMLEKLEFNVKRKDEGILIVTVPSYRSDVEREADLIEEVARMYGYNNIPVTRPESKQQGRKTLKQNLEDLTRELMVGSGLNEVINFSLMSADIYDKLFIPEDSMLRNWVKIKNPLNESLAIMRTSLVPGIINVLAKNAKRQVGEMAVFELENIFLKQGKGEQAQEKMMLAGGSMGYRQDIWNSKVPDFFYLKGILETYFARLGIKEIKFAPIRVSYLHPGRTAGIFCKEKKLGIIGEILPEIIDNLNLKRGTVIFELDFNLLLDEVNLDKKYFLLAKHPAVVRDLAILVKEDISVDNILNFIQDKGGKLLKQVELFDLYKGDQIPEAHKSLAFKLLFQAGDRTLTDQEINELFQRILRSLEKNYGAEIRGI